MHLSIFKWKIVCSLFKLEDSLIILGILFTSFLALQKKCNDQNCTKYFKGYS